ncbi:MAG: FecR family protein [Prevotellaceae bacterium]|jgi:ferric-dicitrate binding protein FerR (iron transport regulator)|nr:FecR family protein [Prevotellaceae bacterium]
MNPINADEWIANVLSANVNAEECSLLKEWIATNLNHKKYFELHWNTWLLSGIEKKAAGFDAKNAFGRFVAHAGGLKPKMWIFRKQLLLQTAIWAAIFALGALSFYYYTIPATTPVAYYETIVPLGAKSQITLTDGTKVWLNAGSRLNYSTAFASQNREVLLEGEGYFEVATNPDLPFEVKTSLLTVRAIGTSFNVKAYPSDPTVETILIDGKVEISRLQENSINTTPIHLQPEQRLTLLKNTNELLFESQPKKEKAPASIAALPAKPVNPKTLQQVKVVPATTNYMINTSWKDKRWRIESEELESLAVKLERRYNVRISFADDYLKAYRFNGTLEDEPIEAILKAMTQVAPVKYELNGAEIILSTNENFRKQHEKLWHNSN